MLRIKAKCNNLKLRGNPKHLQLLGIKCDFCKFTTNYDEKFDRHIKNAHGSLFKEYTCTDCDFKTKVPFVFDRHLQQQHTKRSGKGRITGNKTSFTESNLYTEVDVAAFPSRKKIPEHSVQSIKANSDKGTVSSKSSFPASMQSEECNVKVQAVIIPFVSRKKRLSNDTDVTTDTGCANREKGIFASNKYKTNLDLFVSNADRQNHGECRYDENISNVPIESTLLSVIQMDNVTIRDGKSTDSSSTEFQKEHENDDGNASLNEEVISDFRTSSPYNSSEISLNLRLSEDSDDSDDCQRTNVQISPTFEDINKTTPVSTYTEGKSISPTTELDKLDKEKGKRSFIIDHVENSTQGNTKQINGSNRVSLTSTQYGEDTISLGSVASTNKSRQKRNRRFIHPVLQGYRCEVCNMKSTDQYLLEDHFCSDKLTKAYSDLNIYNDQQMKFDYKDRLNPYKLLQQENRLNKRLKQNTTSYQEELNDQFRNPIDSAHSVSMKVCNASMEQGNVQHKGSYDRDSCMAKTLTSHQSRLCNKINRRMSEDEMSPLKYGRWILKGFNCKDCDFKTSERNLLDCHLKANHEKSCLSLPYLNMDKERTEPRFTVDNISSNSCNDVNIVDQNETNCYLAFQRETPTQDNVMQDSIQENQEKLLGVYSIVCEDVLKGFGNRSELQKECQKEVLETSQAEDIGSEYTEIKKGGKMTCMYCPYSTNTYKMRADHVNVVHIRSTLKCYECSFSSLLKDRFVLHMNNEHNVEITRYKLCICSSFPFYSVNELLIHMKQFCGGERYLNNSTVAEEVRKAERAVTESKVNQCLEEKSLKDLEQFERTVIFECCLCGYGHNTRKELGNHIKRPVQHTLHKATAQDQQLSTIRSLNEKRDSFKCNACHFKTKCLKDIRIHCDVNHKDKSKSYVGTNFDEQFASEHQIWCQQTAKQEEFCTRGKQILPNAGKINIVQTTRKEVLSIHQSNETDSILFHKKNDQGRQLLCTQNSETDCDLTHSFQSSAEIKKSVFAADAPHTLKDGDSSSSQADDSDIGSEFSGERIAPRNSMLDEHQIDMFLPIKDFTISSHKNSHNKDAALETIIADESSINELLNKTGGLKAKDCKPSSIPILNCNIKECSGQYTESSGIGKTTTASQNTTEGDKRYGLKRKREFTIKDVLSNNLETSQSNGKLKKRSNKQLESWVVGTKLMGHLQESLDIQGNDNISDQLNQDDLMANQGTKTAERPSVRNCSEKRGVKYVCNNKKSMQLEIKRDCKKTEEWILNTSAEHPQAITNVFKAGDGNHTAVMKRRLCVLIKKMAAPHNSVVWKNKI